MSDEIAPTAEARIIAAVDGLGRSLRAELGELRVEAATAKAERQADHDRIIEHDAQIRELEQRAALAETVREMDKRLALTATQAATNTADLAALKERVDANATPRVHPVVWLTLALGAAGLLLTLLLNTVDIH